MLAAFSDWFHEVVGKLSGPGGYWHAFGFAAQAVFTARFVVQWIASERRKKSVIPASFWILSIAGTLMILTYSIYLRNPVFILAFSFNSVVYVRNLMLMSREKRQAREAAAET